MKKTVLRITTLLCILVPALAIQAREKVDLEVYATRFDSIPIGIVSFKPTTRTVVKDNQPWEVIANNFDISGKFGVTTAAEYDSALFASKGIALYIDGQYTVEGTSITVECNLRDAATQALVIGKKYKGELKYLRSMVHRYSNEIVEMLFGDRGIFETRILFVKTDGQKKNIAIMDFDGHGRTMLTNSSAINIFPAFIDKSRVLWTSYQSGKPEIWRGSLTDGKAQVFIKGQGLQVSPGVSPIDGTVAYASSQAGTLNIYIRGAGDGSKPRQLTFSRGIDTSPTWSPNGYQIAFTSDRGGNPQIYIMDADGANQRRLTHEGRYNDCASWSPKGDKIAYASVGENYQYHIWVISTNGDEAQKITDIPGTSEFPTWSPDGSLIGFVNKRGTRSDFYVVKPDGGRLRRITTSGDVLMPKWSGF